MSLATGICQRHAGAHGPVGAAARSRTFAVLQGGVDTLAADGRLEDARAAVVAAWSLVHGFATLAATGNLAGAGLTGEGDDDLLDLARRAAGMLYGSQERDSDHG